MSSLIRQRRKVLSQGDCIESIKADDEQPNLELIIGSKTGQKITLFIDKTIS